MLDTKATGWSPDQVIKLGSHVLAGSGDCEWHNHTLWSWIKNFFILQYLSWRLILCKLCYFISQASQQIKTWPEDVLKYEKYTFCGYIWPVVRFLWAWSTDFFQQHWPDYRPFVLSFHLKPRILNQMLSNLQKIQECATKKPISESSRKLRRSRMGQWRC